MSYWQAMSNTEVLAFHAHAHRRRHLAQEGMQGMSTANGPSIRGTFSTFSQLRVAPTSSQLVRLSQELTAVRRAGNVQRTRGGYCKELCQGAKFQAPVPHWLLAPVHPWMFSVQEERWPVVSVIVEFCLDSL